MQDFKEYQLQIMNRALSLLMFNYDEHDLEELMYSGLELESEVEVMCRLCSTIFCAYRYREGTRPRGPSHISLYCTL